MFYIYFIFINYFIFWLYLNKNFNNIHNKLFLSPLRYIINYIFNYVLHILNTKHTFIIDNDNDKTIYVIYNKKYLHLKFYETLTKKIYFTNNISNINLIVPQYFKNYSNTICLTTPHGVFNLFPILFCSLLHNIFYNNAVTLISSSMIFIPFINIISVFFKGINIKKIIDVMKNNYNFLIYLGGTYDQVFSLNEGECFYSEKLKIFDYAIKYNYNIQTMYIFGEHDITKRYEKNINDINFIQKFLFKKRIPLPFVKKINKPSYFVVFGNIIYSNNKTKEQLFLDYKIELNRIFNKYKTNYNKKLINCELKFIPMNIIR